MLGLLMVSIGACTDAVHRREADELENMWRANVIPKTAPKQFVAMFDKTCLAHIDAPENLDRVLRAEDYVEMRGQAGFRTFVVDTKKPLIAIKATPSVRHCYAAAEARTGQSARVNDLVASLPEAREIDPSQTGLPAEQAWMVGPGNRTMIYTLRNGSTFDDPRYVLGIIRL